jgi:hypothetical protein
VCTTGVLGGTNGALPRGVFAPQHFDLAAVVVSLPGNKIGAAMIEDKRPIGRPRKYLSASERLRAFRKRHGLVKVTVDVPAQKAMELRFYAQMLREESKKDVRPGIKETTFVPTMRAFLIATSGTTALGLWDAFRSAKWKRGPWSAYLHIDGPSGSAAVSEQPEKEWSWFVRITDEPERIARGTLSNRKQAMALAEIVYRFLIVDHLNLRKSAASSRR